jgi:hypothetical protein
MGNPKILAKNGWFMAFLAFYGTPVMFVGKPNKKQ